MKPMKNRIATVIALESKSIPRTRSLEPATGGQGALALEDGSIARIEGRALELRDPKGRLLVRYVDGSAEIAAPSGDLVLSSPSGRVVVRSALDIELDASRDVVHRAGRNVDLASGGSEPQLRIEPARTILTSESLRVETNDAELIAGTVSTIARKVATTAESIALSADKYELAATRIFEKSRDAFRDVLDLAQTRVGRARTVVASIFTLNTGRTVLTSNEETSIDGRKILLG